MVATLDLVVTKGLFKEVSYRLRIEYQDGNSHRNIRKGENAG